MLQDYKVQTGRRLKIDWLGFFFTCGLDGEGNASGMHDYIHNNNKLVNLLHMASRTLVLGRDLCLLSHVGQVYKKFSYDEHKLKQEDWTRNDHQNWTAA